MVNPYQVATSPTNGVSQKFQLAARLRKAASTQSNPVNPRPHTHSLMTLLLGFRPLLDSYAPSGYGFISGPGALALYL